MDEYAPGSPRASADLFRYRVSLGQGRSLAVLSDPLHAWGYCIGASLWSAAQELAVYLAGFRRGWLSGKGVLELGAGLGVPGQACLLGGARVVFTDVKTMLPLMRRNITENFGASVFECCGGTRSQPQAAVAELVWGQSLRRHRFSPGKRRFDLILGSDICYDPGQFARLTSTIKAYLHPHPNTRVLLSLPEREESREFLGFALARNFWWRQLRQIRGDHLINPVNIYQMGVMSPTSMAGRALVVWDFDWSLINKDSDETLVKGIGAHHIFERLIHGGMHWNQSMDLTLLAAHDDMGVSKQDALDALMTLPLEKSTKEVIQKLALLDTCDQIILSDANYVSILSVLQQHGIEDCFMDVHTNPAEFRAGALRVSPYHKSDHGCTTLKGTACPPNMCKGKVLEGFLLENNYDMVAYVGDGQGDFCACTRLGPRDLIFARTAYPGKPPENCALLKMLKSNGAAVISDEQKSSAFFKSASTGDLQHMLAPNNRVRSERIASQVVPWSDPDELASCLSKLASGWA